MIRQPEGALIQVEVHSGPLGKCEYKVPKGAGAKLIFTGIVRPDEDEKPIGALHYEMIRPLADFQLGRLASEIAKKHGLKSIAVQHSEGVVPVGKPSFRLIVSATHRENLFAAMREFINEMKRFAAITKHPIYIKPRLP